MPGYDHQFAEQIDEIKRQGLYRSRRLLGSPQGVSINVDGQKLINFSSNDYLGLANHPDIVAAFKRAVAEYGVGSGSAHLICGHHRVHHQLEEELADFVDRDRVLLFANGYMANFGILSTLLGTGDAVFEDRLNHASLLDGGKMSGARFHRYQHGDSGHLKKILNRSRARKKIIATDGVFSMDGDLAPMSDLVALANNNNALLMVDDAHGLGVIGRKGGGVLEAFQLTQHDVPVLMATLGKGFGTYGAFVAGSESLIDFLIQKARTYIFTTALPPALAEATRASLKLIIQDVWRREKLESLSIRLRDGLRQLGLDLIDSQSAIHAIVIGNNDRTSEISSKLLNMGIFASAIRPPTVPKGRARLRITLSANHQDHDVDRLLAALEKVIN
jgi:8-amino-7-oxononanoate synthase